MVINLHHTGVSVRDLEKSIKFYTEVMGMEIDYRAYHKGDRVSKVVDITDAELDVCVVKRGEVRLELIDYRNKEKKDSSYKDQTSPGLIHIAFTVADIDKEYEKIKSMGYIFNSPPMVTRVNGPKICYFRGPDNVIIELYEKVQ